MSLNKQKKYDTLFSVYILICDYYFVIIILLQILRKGKSVGDQVLAKRKKVGEKWEVLDSSLMILDDAIMLFHDF